MKTFKIFSLAMLIAFSASCDLLDQLLPDLDTEFEKTFEINLNSNSGQSDYELIDLSTIEEFEEYEEHITGFELKSIGFEVENYNGPEDMYVSCDLMARSADGNTDVKVGEVKMMNLNSISDSNIEIDVEELAPGINQVIDWFDEPGSFFVNSSYSLTDDAGNLYPVSEQGYALDLKLTYYVTVLTGV